MPIFNTPGWKEIGRSTSSVPENMQRMQLKLSEYYVVVGFEVNNPAAFAGQTHDLAVDYGHAFFYLTMDLKIIQIFSFGPSGLGKQGWFGKAGLSAGAKIKDGYGNSRPGTPDYDISEPVKLFKLALTVKQGKKLEIETERTRQKILSGKQRYTAYLNDTCAETARDILVASDIDTPDAKGKVTKGYDFPVAYAANPYMWHHRFKEAGHKEVSFKPAIPFLTVGKKDPVSWTP